MHFRDLRYFLVLAETLDPTSAALRVGIAKSTLTAAVRRLESEIGGRLCVESRSGLRLTPMGTELLAHAPRLLWLRDQAIKAVQNAEEPSRDPGPDGPPRD